MSLTTFRDAKDSTLADIAGTCTSTELFKSYLNKATRMLMSRGNFWGTVQPLKSCVYNNCWTWPRPVGTILALNVCDRPVPISNHWYQFMPLDETHVRDGLHFNRHGRAGNLTAISDGTTPVFNPINCVNGVYIRVYISQPSDVGKQITLFGIDSNGQTLRGQRPDGTFQDGLVLTLGNPYVQSSILVRRIDRVLKDKTNGPVHAYQVDANGNILDLAHYDAGETSPNYVHQKFNQCRITNSCSGLSQISALVKLAFVPVEFDDDLVLIENLDALQDMIMSIQRKNAGDMQGSQQYELSAFRELNYESRNRFPIEQFQSSFRPFGSARLERVNIAMQ